jgi:hypothetical protein
VIDDILAGVFGELAFGRLGRSRRAQLVARLAFGFLGAALAVIGAWHFTMAAPPRAGLALRASIVALFLFLACFSLFNVALARKWHWPGRLFLASLLALFVARIAFGP